MSITYIVAFLPSSSGAESEANESWPCSPSEQENGEDDTERSTESGANEESAEALIPLRIQLVLWQP